MDILETLKTLWNESGFQSFFVDGGWKNLLMILISCVLLYLGIKKKFEPLLLVGIAFGCLLVNLSYFGAGSTDALYHLDLWDNFLDPSHPDYHSYGAIMREGGLLDILYIGVKAGIYPSLIFMGVGAMTDFGPLISNPKSLLLGAAAQMGVFLAFFGAVCLGFTGQEAASIGIIGGADGPTAIFLTTKLAPHLLGPIAIAAYSYMALIPMIQPPIMRLLTTEKERKVKMEQSRQVSKTEKIIFPIIVAMFVILLLPSTAPLVGCLMLGNLWRECGVTERLSDTVQNALMNIVTVFLGISVGATTAASRFLSLETIKIVFLGLTAFCFSTIGGLLVGKLMYKLSGGKINPLIGSAGVSAVPMAARVSQTEGQKANPSNFLLMHAMGPNVAGVIGSAIAAGFLLAVFK
ncbi:MAG: sodium ion-translocating decarboxylase subunit beta [Clostridiales bacterium]|nr:sodium ion-translocating decarboxylase subunit beta [Ruminococcus sp.]MCM1008830.1 sodium ion-translocating decarboxylase subunit beta [Ruminococcus flavefaciens]MCM1062396.1 sodium ion-translocating decarboxylase subunit beta [Eubacterium sp.]MCM1363085.1 sodium ion-translocating decarboxylase subunit beta [Clostridiales bacterium]